MPHLLRNNVHCKLCRRTPTGELFCHRCNQAKPVDQFYETREWGYYEAGCKSCRRAAAIARSGALATAESKRNRTRAIIVETIGIIVDHRRSGTASLNVIAERSGYSKTQVIRVIRALVESGEVEISADPADRRAWRIRMTGRVSP